MRSATLFQLKLFAVGLWFTAFAWSIARPCTADDGEFWGHAVAETIEVTKPMSDTRVQVAAGISSPLGVDDAALSAPHVPADLRIDIGARFLGFIPRPTVRLLRLRAEAGLGMYDDAGTELDSGHARLSVYTYQKGGMLNVGNVQLSREKALGEQAVLRIDTLDLSVGGAVKAFIFGLNLNMLGYERRWLYDRDTYDGFFLTKLGLDMGFVLFRKARVASLEIATHGDIAVSLPTQKDARALGVLAVHFNNFVLPVEVAGFGGFAYTLHADDDDIYYFSVGGRVSLRY
jgi:hypothetical protein